MGPVDRFDAAALGLPGCAEAARELVRAAEEQGTPVLLVGALARDLLLYHAVGEPAPAQTRDADFAVCVSDEAAYARLSARLVEGAAWQVTRRPYCYHTRSGLVVDLIPFGGVEREGWVRLRGQEYDLNVLGFREALEDATPISLGQAPIRLLSHRAFLLLKLLAWRDRREPRDAEDLARLLTRVFEQRLEHVVAAHYSLFDQYEDVHRIGAHSLGRDAATLASKNARLQQQAAAVLVAETDLDSPMALLHAMGNREVFATDDRLGLLNALRDGFLERTR